MFWKYIYFKLDFVLNINLFIMLFLRLLRFDFTPRVDIENLGLRGLSRVVLSFHFPSLIIEGKTWGHRRIVTWYLREPKMILKVPNIKIWYCLLKDIFKIIVLSKHTVVLYWLAYKWCLGVLIRLCIILFCKHEDLRLGQYEFFVISNGGSVLLSFKTKWK